MRPGGPAEGERHAKGDRRTAGQDLTVSDLASFRGGEATLRLHYDRNSNRRVKIM